MAGNARSRRGAPRPSRTGWDHLAGWYDGWVGDHGSRYHQRIAIPTLLDLLAIRRGEHVLDVGCGSGVLAAHVRAGGAEYVGVDISPQMVAIARRRHARDGRFVVGDARRLDRLAELRGRPFDAATFLLSIGDMDDLEAVTDSTASLLAARSRIVLLLTHPAFRIARHSGWGNDPSRRLTYRRLDGYLSPLAVPLSGRPGSGPSTSFHRPLSTYVNTLAARGFAIDAMREPGDLPDRPGNPDIPLFLGIRAVRGARDTGRGRPPGSTRRTR